MPDIDDLISFHCESVSGFAQAFHEAVDEYISACEKLGQLPEKPASGCLMLGADPVVHAAAAKAAAHTGLSLNRWAERVLRQATHVCPTALLSACAPCNSGSHRRFASGAHVSFRCFMRLICCIVAPDAGEFHHGTHGPPLPCFRCRLSCR